MAYQKFRVKHACAKSKSLSWITAISFASRRVDKFTRAQKALQELSQLQGGCVDIKRRVRPERDSDMFVLLAVLGILLLMGRLDFKKLLPWAMVLANTYGRAPFHHWTRIVA